MYSNTHSLVKRARCKITRGSPKSFCVFTDWIDSRVTHSISNLLNNAMKFTERGRIRILCKALHNENAIEISVTDTGRGISDEMMQILFQKFATGGHGNVQNSNGTGLGLYLCKVIVNGHNGDISAFTTAKVERILSSLYQYQLGNDQSEFTAIPAD